MEKSMKTYGDSSLRWNPPEFTQEDVNIAREGRKELIRKAAMDWDVSGEWQRAMNVELSM
jgi:hypothetical protein